MDRNKVIIRTSITGILVNVLLSGFKAAVGIMTASIAITLDAVNNLSDALSSVITVVGTKLASKKPDKKHPFGHGRIEYISTMIIAIIVLYAGITALIEAIKKIVYPTLPDYNAVSLVIIGVAVAVKIFLGIYFGKTGKKVNSESLVASGKDALLDSIISATTLVAAILFMSFGLSTEAWLGAVISLFIIKSGVEILAHTISEILGERIDSSLAKAIKQTIRSFPEVFGAYDLILHSYGPELLIGSVHIEISEDMTASKIDVLEHKISEKVFEIHGVLITGISIYSHNLKDEKTAEIFGEVRKITMEKEYVLQMHGFYLNEEEKTLHFDVIVDFAAPDREHIFEKILSEVREQFPDYRVSATLDG
ncbi:MAG: cation transporter, partial [Clostridia bacterium]|nr:cation transporter [Clostridia bacterium]